MADTPTPANLHAYYCETCHGIIVTNNPAKVDEKYHLNCPFCSDESLVLLDNELYQNDFDDNAFPHPQNLLLRQFFMNLDDSALLFSIFGNGNPMEIILQATEYHDDYDHLIILIDQSLNIDCQLFLQNDGFSSWRGTSNNLIQRLETLR
ncbi:MAG: hypothetical protein QNJ64_08415 [Crocosphaera sp.]|nr:hypothetical protein [Crocosphaera sp.]